MTQTTKVMVKQIKERAKAVGKERDKIRELISEWEMLADNCDTAIEHLERAADELSQLV
jgi:predicted hydrolase (HD superfamily)